MDSQLHLRGSLWCAQIPLLHMPVWNRVGKHNHALEKAFSRHGLTDDTNIPDQSTNEFSAEDIVSELHELEEQQSLDIDRYLGCNIAYC